MTTLIEDRDRIQKHLALIEGAGIAVGDGSGPVTAEIARAYVQECKSHIAEITAIIEQMVPPDA